MAGDPGPYFAFHLSGGASNNDADLSLGGAFSNYRVDTLITSVASVGAAGDKRLILANVNSGSVNSVLSIRNGSSGGFYTRIVDADAPGPNTWVDLLDPLPAAAEIASSVFEFRAVDVSMPFGVTTAQESADGFTQYFGGYLISTGGTHNDWGVHIEETNPGNVIHEIAVASDPAPPLLNTIPNNTTPPDLSGMMLGGNRGSFVRPLTKAERTPRVNVTGYVAYGFWIKRIVPPGCRRQSDQIVSLVCTDSGSLVANLVLHWNTAGFTPLVTLLQSPSLYIRGGAQFRTNVKAVETGLDVEGIPVAMRQVSGPGTFYPPAAPAETDEHGNVIGHYTAPTDVGQIGQTVEIEAEV